MSIRTEATVRLNLSLATTQALSDMSKPEKPFFGGGTHINVPDLRAWVKSKSKRDTPFNFFPTFLPHIPPCPCFYVSAAVT